MAEWTAQGLNHKIGDYRVSPDGLRVGVGIGPYDVMPSKSKAAERATGQSQTPAPVAPSPQEHYSSAGAEETEERMYRGVERTRARWAAEKAARGELAEEKPEPKKAGGFFSRLFGL